MNRFALQPAQVDSVLPADGRRPVRRGAKYSRFAERVNPSAFELRVEWEPALEGERPGEAKVVRKLLSIGGRPPRPKDEPGCVDPKAVSPAPLALLLPGKRNDFMFKRVGIRRSGGRTSETDDVLWLDEHLIGMFDLAVPREHTRHGDHMWMTIERADSSIRYRPVSFTDPDETMMLPSSIESLTIVRNAGVPRLRTTQTLSDDRRFVTGGRLVKDE